MQINVKMSLKNNTECLRSLRMCLRNRFRSDFQAFTPLRTPSATAQLQTALNWVKMTSGSYVLQYREFLMVNCQHSGRRLTWSEVLKGYTSPINFLLCYI